VNSEKLGNSKDYFLDKLKVLGFMKEDYSLCFTKKSTENSDPLLKFHIERAKEDFKADAVYLTKQFNGSLKPQVYIYDFTDRELYQQDDSKELADIQKKIWSSGEAPLACVFYKTEIKIINCSKKINEDYTPEFLIKDLKFAAKVHKLYNEQFAVKIKTGVFWEEEDVKNQFSFADTSYNLLLENIKTIIRFLNNTYVTTKNQKNTEFKKLLNKIIVHSILVKYLEERIDKDGNKLLSSKYFNKYNDSETFNNSETFIDVLRNNNFFELLSDLNDENTGLNGNVFQWTEEEIELVKDVDFSLIIEWLKTDEPDLKTKQKSLWRYFEFSYIPIELISRLYEEFLSDEPKKEEKKKGEQGNGQYFTPSHLASLLVDECLPLSKYKEIDVENYKILDPACGSGIFLVLAFKRLVQIWRLQNGKKPDINVLKKLLKNLYGVDIDGQAISLAAFSLCLALCNELEPIKILNELTFDDLRKENIIKSDFLKCDKIKDKKFDLIIGNPPFSRGKSKYTCEIAGQTINIPQGQIALKFLADSLEYLEDKKGLLCLIIKSSSLLYNSTSIEFKKLLFLNYNIIQLLDFTALARNKVLWDNGRDVDTTAIFLKNEKPDFSKNILHLTFRRTKATKERIAFEIDDYDLHFVNRHTAINNQYIWKNNLLGGGRIKNTIEKLILLPHLQNFLIRHNICCTEGVEGAKCLPNEAFTQNGIDDKYLTNEYNATYLNKKDKNVFLVPNILIKENIELPYCYNENPKVKFSNEIVGIYSKNKEILINIIDYLKKFNTILKYFNAATSGKMLVYKNTTCKKEDILALPFDLDIDLFSFLSIFDQNIISDVNTYMQDFLRHGEKSTAVEPINKDFDDVLKNYGNEFSRALNVMYEKNGKKFRLANYIKLDNSFIATIFRYDTKQEEPTSDLEEIDFDLDDLIRKKLSKNLFATRIIKLYPQKDTVVFVKPNQYRYWISLTAYRDADKCFSDFANAGL